MLMQRRTASCVRALRHDEGIAKLKGGGRLMRDAVLQGAGRWSASGEYPGPELCSDNRCRQCVDS